MPWKFFRLLKRCAVKVEKIKNYIKGYFCTKNPQRPGVNGGGSQSTEGLFLAPPQSSLIYTPPRSPRPHQRNKFKFPANSEQSISNPSPRYVPPSPLQLWKIGRKDGQASLQVPKTNLAMVATNQNHNEKQSNTSGQVSLHRNLEIGWF